MNLQAELQKITFAVEEVILRHELEMFDEQMQRLPEAQELIRIQVIYRPACSRCGR